MANRNLSPETQAIIDRLKAEGDLVRNSGTNSIRSVKINLDRFEGIFNTISANIAEQTNILRVQSGIAQEQVERDRNKEQFEEVTPKEKYDNQQENNSTKLVSDEQNTKINKIGDSISAALSLKNIMLAGAGIFVGYNFLKGFIDEKTGGGWTEFENNIGPFARSLPETMRSLQTFVTGLPETFRQTSVDLKDSMFNIKTNIENMTTEVIKLTTRIGEIIENFSTLGGMISALTSAIGIFSVAGAFNRIYDVFRRNGRIPTPTGNVPDVDANGRPRTPAPDVDADGRPRTPAPDVDANGTPRTPAAAGAAAQAAAPPAQTGPGRGRMVEGRGERAEALRQQAGQAARNVTDVESTISNPRMRKVYTRLLKGFGVLGLAMTIYQAQQLAALLNDDSVEEPDKIGAVGAFIGELAGGASLAVGLGVLGTTFGPWGTLIGAILGGTIGSFAGGWLGEYVARWAFDESPSAEDIAESRRQQGIDRYYEQVEARPTAGGHTGRTARARWDASYGETHNADGTPKNTRAGGGRGNVVERDGEREQYMRDQDAQMLDALIEAERRNQAEAAERQDLEQYLGIQRDGTTGRISGSEILGSNAGTGGGGSAPIVYSPVINAPMSYSIGGDNVAVASFNDRRGGGGGRLPYGLTGAFS
jgi:hypothetical protein